MGGEPDPTVAKIKNMVYMNHTVGSPKNESRDDYLGEYSFYIDFFFSVLLLSNAIMSVIFPHYTKRQ